MLSEFSTTVQWPIEANDLKDTIDSSITSSARASSVGGMFNASIRAVARLINSSNVVGCSKGKTAGLAPFSTCPRNSRLRASCAVGNLLLDLAQNTLNEAPQAHTGILACEEFDWIGQFPLGARSNGQRRRTGH